MARVRLEGGTIWKGEVRGVHYMDYGRRGWVTNLLGEGRSELGEQGEVEGHGG